MFFQGESVKFLRANNHISYYAFFDSCFPKLMIHPSTHVPVLQLTETLPSKHNGF